MDEQIVVLAEGPGLDADLHLPAGAGGMVVFAHGSGSSRRSGRNIQVARELQRAGLATLLFDLLTGDEERRDAVDASLRFDIPFLTDRLTAVVDEVVVRPPVAGLPVGLFGASTGAAAALGTAAARPGVVHSVVSRGGRPDLAAEALSEVRAPTLLLVGSLDRQVIALNEQAAARLPAEHQLSIIPGATHLFEEPGTLEEVARQAAAWFVRTLPPAPG
ncbi:dienelactone hydrolase family protein [Arthrobacter crystallopoietes]|uniref:dienelactone hydrolase family protein n=1 Tax=Crystallibacter crystallopoietes TaxID=37928 RepID=UPI0011113B4D|nr:alpha/beta family hydrolase [Arthrobacter crystallopoietes]QTG81861.1 dienelactone hydrolase family protein [Arthrobacter crystallopoietes]